MKQSAPPKLISSTGHLQEELRQSLWRQFKHIWRRCPIAPSSADTLEKQAGSGVVSRQLCYDIRGAASYSSERSVFLILTQSREELLDAAMSRELVMIRASTIVKATKGKDDALASFELKGCASYDTIIAIDRVIMLSVSS